MGRYYCPDCGRDIGHDVPHANNCPRGDGPEMPDNTEQLDRIEKMLDKVFRLQRKLAKDIIELKKGKTP